MTPKKKRLLFVCYGNICRSPMAEGIARARLGPDWTVASAGIGAAGGPAAEEAIRVMKAVYKVDISAHIARPVAVFDLKSFDYVIAMDPAIARHLRTVWGVTGSALCGWDIEDPLGSDFETFKDAALKIERRLDRFLAAVGLAD